MEWKWLRTSLVAVLSLAVVAVAWAEDKKNEPPAPARLRFPGLVKADACAGLSFRVAGVVEKILVDEGDRVNKGQVLIELSAPELNDDLDAAAARLDQSKAEVEQAKASVEEAEARANTAGAARDLAAAGVAHARAGVMVAQAGVKFAQAEMRRAQTQLSFTRLVAPYSGVVARRTVDVGTTVGPPKQGESAPLLTVMRDDVVQVVFDVDERSAPLVAIGASVVVRAPSLGNAEFNGKLTRKGGAFDPATRTVRAEVALPNPDGKLRPGMIVTVDMAGDKPAR